ncbi:hypothetical protein M413DRAFT_12525 [Hebeloma cylindrosporum]|uniref:Ubiquitin-like domain-containing protein n=1 Tax=Hebeloma cylindrosporum TaxID=76867 RepID=A0A0C3C5N0_HEBCY|nr:hypothetical protein M413DRAFT_12525 [Hebeloma cylindrosporum h7]
MIDSPSATAAVQPGIVIPDPERDTSRDRWDRPRLGQDVVPVLTVVGPILEAIPIAGPALKATVGAVLEILKTINQINQNKGDFEKLEEKLRCLEDHISLVPVPPQGISKGRDDLTRQLQTTLIKLRSIQGERRIRYSIVAQTISECSLDIDHYLQRYTALEVMDMRGKMDMYISSTSPMRSKITGVVLIDATGKKYEVSMDSSRSYEMFKKTMALFFDGDRMEARIQRRYMEEGRYDLCIERGNRIIPIAGEEDWTAIEPGMQLTMRAIISKYRYDPRRHECPRCKTWNFSRGGASVFVEWFQISVSRDCGLGDVRSCEEDRQSGMEMGVLINLHLKEYPLESFQVVWTEGYNRDLLDFLKSVTRSYLILSTGGTFLIGYQGPPSQRDLPNPSIQCLGLSPSFARVCSRVEYQIVSEFLPSTR